MRSIPIKSYRPNTPVLGIPIGRPNKASAISTGIFLSRASYIATCIAYTPTRFPIKPGVSLQLTIPLPNWFSQKSFKIFILSWLRFGVSTISNKRINLTGLKKWVIQKSFFISSDICSVKIANGIVDVLEETIDCEFLVSSIFL